MRLGHFSIILFSVVFTSAAHAIDFDQYKPTLDNSSSYNLIFNVVTKNNNDFVYYRNGKPIYYKIGTTVQKNGIVLLETINIDQEGADVIGNFWNLSNGAIANYYGRIGNINSDFINNSAWWDGGAIYNFDTIGDVVGDFINNKASYGGGAIANYMGTIGNISGYFIGNHADGYGAGGGAIYNDNIIGEISGSFIANSTGTLGGAIYTLANLNFVADGTENFFTGNYIGTKGSGKIYNAIYADDSILSFKTQNSGSFIFDDNIDGHRYDISLIGDNSGKFFMNNDIANVGSISVSDTMLIFGEGAYGRGAFSNSTPNFSINDGQFYLYNQYLETVKVKNYTATGDNKLHIDVDKVGDVWTADVLDIAGDVQGTTQVVVYSLNDGSDFTGIVFVKAPNDDLGTAADFAVYRVYGNPYIFDSEHQGTDWYLVPTTEKNTYTALPDIVKSGDLPENPIVPVIPEDPKKPIIIKPQVVAEVEDFRALQVVAIEQTRSMVRNILNEVNLDRNLWVNPIYRTANIDAPIEMEADIRGLEAGFDLQGDLNHKLGIFASYRQGEYDLDNSQIDIDSYMAGMYYRYGYRHLRVFATTHGGIQKADIETNDGVSSDTDGTEMGVSAEVGYVYTLTDTFKLEPSLSIFYTQVDFDDADTKYGLNAGWSTIRQTEVEAGVELEKYLAGDSGFIRLYIKPSVVQVITGGDEVKITGLNKISTYKDGTLGRIELGARHAITDALSAYGFVNYTVGSDYDATSLGAGLNYSW